MSLILLISPDKMRAYSNIEKLPLKWTAKKIDWIFRHQESNLGLLWSRYLSPAILTLDQAGFA
jgi:hypothetical protein